MSSAGTAFRSSSSGSDSALRSDSPRAGECEAIDGEGIPTLIEWAGGPVALTRLIHAFYDRVEADDLQSLIFPGGVSQTHRQHVSAWWIEVLGGQARYTEQLGGYEAMLSHHRGIGITGEQRLRFTTTMSQAADDADLPADPEFRAALVGYLEWGGNSLDKTSA